MISHDLFLLLFHCQRRDSRRRVRHTVIADYMPLVNHALHQCRFRLCIRLRDKKDGMHALFLKRIQNGFRVTVFISLIKGQIDGLCVLSNEKRMVIPILLLRTDCIVRAVVRIGVASQPPALHGGIQPVKRNRLHRRISTCSTLTVSGAASCLVRPLSVSGVISRSIRALIVSGAVSRSIRTLTVSGAASRFACALTVSIRNLVGTVCLRRCKHCVTDGGSVRIQLFIEKLVIGCIVDKSHLDDAGRHVRMYIDIIIGGFSSLGSLFHAAVSLDSRRIQHFHNVVCEGIRLLRTTRRDPGLYAVTLAVIAVQRQHIIRTALIGNPAPL